MNALESKISVLESHIERLENSMRLHGISEAYIRRTKNIPVDIQNDVHAKLNEVDQKNEAVVAEYSPAESEGEWNPKDLVIIELSDWEYRVVTYEQLDEINNSAEEFDGFVGHTEWGSIQDLIDKHISDKPTEQPPPADSITDEEINEMFPIPERPTRGKKEKEVDYDTRLSVYSFSKAFIKREREGAIRMRDRLQGTERLKNDPEEFVKWIGREYADFQYEPKSGEWAVYGQGERLAYKTSELLALFREQNKD